MSNKECAKGMMAFGRSFRKLFARTAGRERGGAVFIVELNTTTGKVCESYETYEEARRRVEFLPAEALAGLPMIFEELPDGSQRLVREDGKPLQWHRLEEDRPPGPDDALPLADDSSELLGEGKWVLKENPGPQETDWGEDDEPLPLD